MSILDELGLQTQKKLQAQSIVQMEQMVRSSFSRVKEELDEHLEAINDNTSEIQTNYEAIEQLSAKVDKLNEKFEQILAALGEQKKPQTRYVVEQLTLREQEVFVWLYGLHTGEQTSYVDLSRRVGLPVDMIQQIVASLITKGVPVIKRYNDDDLMLELDSEFKLYQAKTNILQLNEQLIKQVTVR